MQTATPGAPTLGDALTRHYTAHGLPPDGGEQNAWFRIHVGPLTIPLPNPPARRAAVFYHDANHVLTGYNTVFSEGEMVIAGFELGNGCGRYWVAWLLNFFMFAIGLAVVPRPMLDAFARGRRAGSIYRRPEPREALKAMSVRDVKALTGLDETRGDPTTGEVLGFAVWATAALGVVVGALALVFAVAAPSA